MPSWSTWEVGEQASSNCGRRVAVRGVPGSGKTVTANTVLVRKLFKDKPNRTVIIVNGNFDYVFKVEPAAAGSSNSACGGAVKVSSCKRRHFDRADEPALEIPTNLLLMGAGSGNVPFVAGQCASATIFVSSMDPAHFVHAKQSGPPYRTLYFPPWMVQEVVEAYDFRVLDSKVCDKAGLKVRLNTAGPFPLYVSASQKFIERRTAWIVLWVMNSSLLGSVGVATTRLRVYILLAPCKRRMARSISTRSR